MWLVETVRPPSPPPRPNVRQSRRRPPAPWLRNIGIAAPPLPASPAATFFEFRTAHGNCKRARAEKKARGMRWEERWRNEERSRCGGFFSGRLDRASRSPYSPPQSGRNSTPPVNFVHPRARRFALPSVIHTFALRRKGPGVRKRPTRFSAKRKRRKKTKARLPSFSRSLLSDKNKYAAISEGWLACPLPFERKETITRY
jgi:hypothetical protein